MAYGKAYIAIKEIDIAYVKVGNNEHLEGALKRFKKQVDKEGIMKKYKEKQYYTKPSLEKHQEVRTVKHKLAKKRKSNKK